ncbi:unnamed protein product [Moneuplotes crassus]|uniref:Uncharacterized protein n=1 Tax=Euplotes crassus TaxID=5936 RepID=A0AAD1Y546_EUPCR|nr:unnamed protein product [Moneuplotes crassus]
MAVVKQTLQTSYNEVFLKTKEGPTRKRKHQRIAGVKYTGLNLIGSGQPLFSPDSKNKKSNYYNFSKQKNSGLKHKTSGKKKTGSKLKDLSSKKTFEYSCLKQDNCNIFNNSKTFSQCSQNSTGVLQELEHLQENWMDSEELAKLVKYQEYLVDENYFDPFTYFGCSYMRDYKFYINNPKLDCVFKHDSNLHDPKILLQSSPSAKIPISDIEIGTEFDVTDQCNESFEINTNHGAKTHKECNHYANKKQVKSSKYQSMQSLNESMSNYLILNNPKNLIKKLIPPSKENRSVYCDTGGSSLASKSPITVDLSSSSRILFPKKCETVKNKNKKQFQMGKPIDEKSLEKKNQIKKCKIDLLGSEKYAHKGCKSALEKSLKGSRSPSPSNPHNSYYMKLSGNQKMHPKMSQYKSSLLNFESNNSFKSLKGSPTNGKSKLELNRSYSNTKNISMLQKPSNRGKLHYDSFLEYLNETMKSASTVESKNVKIFKNSKMSKQKQVKLKKSIDSAVMPSDRIKPKSTKHKSKPTNPSYGAKLNKSSSFKPCMKKTSSLITSGLAAFKPDYGYSNDKVVNPKKPKKLKSRESSRTRPSKHRPKSKSKTKNKRSKEKSNTNLQKYNEACKKKPHGPNSAALLCKKIKDEINYFGSSKLSKYMKSCKEKSVKGKKKQKKLESSKFANIKKPVIETKKVTKRKLLDAPSEYFGHRGGSMDVNYQLKAFLNCKNSIKSEFAKSNRSNCSRQNSVKQGASLETSLNSQLCMKSQRNPYTKFKKFFF